MIECNWVAQNLRLILLGQGRIEENTSVWLLGQGQPVHSAAEVAGYLPGGQFHHTHGASEFREYELRDSKNLQYST